MGTISVLLMCGAWDEVELADDHGRPVPLGDLYPLEWQRAAQMAPKKGLVLVDGEV